MSHSARVISARVFTSRVTNSVAPEPENSSSSSQQPATGPYPQPTESTPPPPQPISLTRIHSDPMLPSTPRSSERSLSFGLSQQNHVHFSLLSDACHMPRPPHYPSFDLNTNYEAPHCAIFSILLLLHSSYVQIFPSLYCSGTPPVYALALM
jgi:hypothetical protein